MPKHTVVSMPGDGIGNQVLPESIRVLNAVGFDAEYIHADIGWDIWCREGNALPDRTIQLARKAQARTLRRHHFEAQQRSSGRTRARASRQGLRVLQPDRHDAPEVQSRYLHASRASDSSAIRSTSFASAPTAASTSHRSTRRFSAREPKACMPESSGRIHPRTFAPL